MADKDHTQLPTRLVELAVSAFGRLDGVVINHGILEPNKVADVSLEEFRRVYDINVLSCFAVVRRTTSPWPQPNSQEGPVLITPKPLTSG